MTEIESILAKRIMVLDGAMGTMIQTRKLQEADFRGDRFSTHPLPQKGNNDLLSLTQPDIIKDIHRQYLEAGADIISTNTFNSNRISMADYGMESFVYEINETSVHLAKEAIQKYNNEHPQKPLFVAGSIGPTNKTLSMSPRVEDAGYRDINFDQLAEVYAEQVSGLMDGGADLLIVETIFDTLNAKAAIYAIKEIFRQKGKTIPLIISGTLLDKSARTLSGQTLEAFVVSVAHANPLCIGLNCSTGAKDMLPHIIELGKITNSYVSAYPNAGFPNELGLYDQTPAIMTNQIEDFFKSKAVNIIGGCCGTTPEHIKHFAQQAALFEPRKKIDTEKLTRLSGLEALVIKKENNFINIGERTNVAGSKKFARLISEKKYDEAIDIARKQVEGGAQIIDVCMDDAMLDAKESMTTFLNLLATEPSVSKVPIMIDSSKWEVLEAGLKCVQGKSIVNSISLKEGEAVFIEKAQKIMQYGAAAVVMAFDEKGQADTYERKIAVCQRAYKLLTEQVGFNPEDIIFDPNVLAVATGLEEHNNYALDFIKSVDWIKKNLPYAKVSGGISNLSFSFRGNNKVREAMHTVFLYHATRVGMDMGIVNPEMIEIYDNIPQDLLTLTEDVILNRRPDATEHLITFADSVKNSDSKEIKLDEWRNEPIQERLCHAIVKGTSEYVEQDIAEAQTLYPKALHIIEGPLMKGMNTVGELFGSGKMFLPQVVKSAQVMKKAVSFLLPFIEAEKSSDEISSSGKVLIATVKGDVHDIGKNIAGVVLACNGYEVIDLGVMVPTEKIIAVAKEKKVDIIGLSGLITPSLEEMAHVAEEMEKEGLTIPLLISGATTSKIHTAVKIAPAYSGAVIYVKDASINIAVASKLLSKETAPTYIQEIKAEYETIRQKYEAETGTAKFIPLQEARKNKFVINWTKNAPVQPKFVGVKVLKDVDIKEIIPFINWSAFLHVWKLSGKYADDAKGQEAAKLLNDAKKMLQNIIEKKMLVLNGVFGIFPAYSDGDDVVIHKNKNEATDKFYFLRNQQPNKEQNLCLSDFIAPKEYNDWIGAFALTAGIGIEKWLEEYDSKHNHYESIMLKLLADRLVEAFSEWLHLKIRTEYWGYSQESSSSIETLLHEKYTGIRPAIGYSSAPDHSEKETLFRLLDAKNNTGMRLTENYAMYPNASVSGLYFANPQACYFDVGNISSDQLIDYAKRKGEQEDTIKKWIGKNIL